MSRFMVNRVKNKHKRFCFIFHISNSSVFQKTLKRMGLKHKSGFIGFKCYILYITIPGYLKRNEYGRDLI